MCDYDCLPLVELVVAVLGPCLIVARKSLIKVAGIVNGRDN